MRRKTAKYQGKLTSASFQSPGLEKDSKRSAPHNNLSWTLELISHKLGKERRLESTSSKNTRNEHNIREGKVFIIQFNINLLFAHC